MSDLISRADAIEAVRYLIYDRQEKGAKPFKWWFIKQRLNAIPSADAVQGEWAEEDEYGDLWVCDQCGFASEYKDNYCPNCGARMKGGAE